MTNEVKGKLVEKTMKDMLETLSGVEKYVLVKKLVDLQQRIDKAIEYLTDENRVSSEDCYTKICETLESRELVNILRGDE